MDRRRRALLWIIVACAMKKKLEKRKRFWGEPLSRHRHTLGNYTQIFQELVSGNAEDLETRLRMPVAAFLTILDKVHPYITRQDTMMRESIPPGARLEAALLFLSSGESYSRVGNSTRISQASISFLVPEVCQAIYKAFKDEYLQTPTSPEEWMAVAEGFQTRCHFPNCVGAIGGRHIPILTPSKEASLYSNYIGKHSVALVAVANSNYEFNYVDVGTSGRVSDRAIWANCSLASQLAENKAGLPADGFLPNSQKHLPYVFVGEDGLPLEPYLMKPFPPGNERKEKRIFNYRVSRASRIIENAFGILANKFRIFLSPIRVSPEKAGEIVMCCIVLHNFLRREYTSEYTPLGSLDKENTEDGTLSDGSWRKGGQLLPLKSSSGNSKKVAKIVRAEFMEYFNGDGAVPWQGRMVNSN